MEMIRLEHVTKALEHRLFWMIFRFLLRRGRL